MKRLIVYLFFFFTTLNSFGQKKNVVNLTLSGGPSYFFTDKTINRRVNNSALIGLNYTIANKNQTLVFCPGLFVQFNQFGIRTSDYVIVRLSQHSIGLCLDMLLRLSKKSLLRAGLFFNNVYYSDIFVSNSAFAGGYYSYGYDELSKTYSSKNLQVGFTLGVSFLFKLKKRENKFNIKLVQTVSSLVNYDYIIPEKLVGKDVRFLSTKSLPTVLLIGFDFSLERFKKGKKIEEDE
ncbi:hypothetical protein [Aurantibacillus circumpalustris]|uniref:hypothetical protein n=1 Tax=Aurantibacillus circumpalustris TaxID=3036359 RepID=UPI00295A7041|nr:hypothetical protein [Aurantibacillus circumpalustris]